MCTKSRVASSRAFFFGPGDLGLFQGSNRWSRGTLGLNFGATRKRKHLELKEPAEAWLPTCNDMAPLSLHCPPPLTPNMSVNYSTLAAFYVLWVGSKVVAANAWETFSFVSWERLVLVLVFISNVDTLMLLVHGNLLWIHYFLRGDKCSVANLMCSFWRLTCYPMSHYTSCLEGY